MKTVLQSPNSAESRSFEQGHLHCKFQCNHLRFLARIILGLWGLLTPVNGQSRFPITTTFNSSFEGWTASGSTAYVGEGYIAHSDMIGDHVRITAPAAYHGSWIELDGTGAISFDHMVITTGAFDDRMPYKVTIKSADSTAVWIGPEPATGSYTRWVRINAPIVVSAWVVTRGSWDELIQNVSGLEIDLELFNNGSKAWRDKNAIDNIRLGMSSAFNESQPTVNFLPVLEFKRDLGTPYAVSASNDLGAFHVIESGIGTGSSVQIVDEDVRTSRFYRVENLSIPPPELIINSAYYGTSTTYKNVTNIIRRNVQGSSLYLHVNNFTMLGDPAPNNAKHISINYTLGNQTTSVQIPENGFVSILRNFE